MEHDILDSMKECKIWNGSIDRLGYGRIGKKRILAHRFTWESFHGPIPKGLVIRHLVCNNPSCVEITHLAIGTQADNMKDKFIHGTNPAGERNGRAKLKRQQVDEIREKYLNNKVTHAELAKEYKVSRTQITRIINKQRFI